MDKVISLIIVFILYFSLFFHLRVSCFLLSLSLSFSLYAHLCPSTNLFNYSGAPYCMFAGRDATKGLGTFKLKNLDDDDWSDLSEKHMENAQRWHSQFKVKYPIIGTLKRDFKKKTLNNNDELKSEEKIQESKKNTANRGGRPATPMPKKESRFCLIL
ncbi:DgyrCDS12938 [Dimorphilus gyrociliatus]|uniref:DgyrCDS12938 n=1 Tax=Dimorphilus gyrociliatus TaxID=2664684 RepID=A0A7I8W962_9ANNE|nr:DgyrCDS12938 [Dimorphilus gyrociliatus]